MKFFNRSCFVFPIMLTGILLVSFAWGQSHPSSTHYVLPWRAMDGGGNEGGSVSSPSYKLSSAIAQGTAIGTTWVSSASYLGHPGFRKVDLDWRPPFTQFLGTLSLVDTITIDSIIIQWTGQDTTVEDGQGWGMWVYDLQITSDTTAGWPAGWHDWSGYMGTGDTFAILSGLGNGVTYCFRVRGHDLATNVGPWDTTATIVDVECVYVLLDMYTLSLATTDDLCSLWIDGGVNESPYSNIYSPGANVHVDVVDSTIFGDTIMTIFDHWVSTSTDTFLELTMTGDYTDTAVYNIFYSLDVTSAHDTPVPDGHTWWAADTEASGYMTDPFIDAGSDWYICTGFLGTGSAPIIASGHTFWFEIDQPSTVTWMWDTIPPGSPLCTLIVFSPYGHPMPAGTTFYPIGTILYASVEESVYVSGDGWHYCTGWVGGGSVSPPSGVGNSVSFMITENSWLVWCWDGSCSMPLIVENDGVGTHPPDGYDTPVPTVGLHWYPYHGSVNAYITTTPADGYQCVGYEANPGGSVTPSAGLETDLAFNIDAPTSIHWRWYPEGADLCTLYVYSPYLDHPAPSLGVHVFPAGTTMTAAVSESTYEAAAWHYATGYWGSGSVPTCTTGVCDPTPWTVDFTLDVTSELVWIWDGIIRFPLIVENDGVTPTNPDGYDTPTPTVGTHWYPYGVLASCSITTPADGMQCTHHTIRYNMSSMISDTTTSFDAVIEVPTIVHWYWTDESDVIVHLTVYSEHGGPFDLVPCTGVHAFVLGTDTSAWAADSVYEAGDWWYCNGWIGDGSVVPASGTSNSVSFTMGADGWIVWQWDTIPGSAVIRWPFVVSAAPAEHDTPVPDYGLYWYDDSTIISGYITDPVDGVWMCIGYAGYGDMWSGLFTHFEDLMITQPSGITWLWSDDAHQVIIRKNPLADVYGQIIVEGTGVTSAIETLYVVDGDTIDIDVTTPDYFAAGESRYSFVQWSDAHPTTDRTELITADEEFVADYILEHHVVVEKDPSVNTLGSIYLDAVAHPGSSMVESWWEDGSNHDVAVSERDSSACARYIFDQWEDASTDTARLYNVTGPATLTAYYNEQFYVVIQKNPPEPHGCIYAEGMANLGVAEYAFWVDGGTVIQFAVSPFDTTPGVDTICTFVDWVDGGTDTLHASELISHCDTFVANYSCEEAILCMLLSQHGGPTDSIYWIVEGGDSLEVGTTHDMPMADMTTIENCGNIPLQMVLWVHGTFDQATATAVPWTAGFLQAENQFVLRARFEMSPVPPFTYHHSKDYLKATPTEATNTSDVPSAILGPGGGKIIPTQEEYLFFEFLMPTNSTFWDPLYIHVKLLGKVRLD